jgi:ABC-2 type transport system permease protein
MKWRRTWAVARKEFLHVLRDPGSLTMALATPALLLMLFGYALSLDVDNVPLAVWDQSGTERSRELISRFTGSRYFSLRYYVNNYADLVRGIDQGQVVMGLIVPRDFAQQVGAGHNAPAQLIVDGTDSNTATIAISYADVIAQIYALDLSVEQSERHGGSRPAVPLDVRPRVWYNEDLDSRNYLIPGLIAVIMMVISAMLTSLTVAREWERGTMEQLISTPVKISEVIVGKLVPYFVVGAVGVILAMAMGEFLFHVPLRGSVALVLGTSALFLVGSLAMGILISIVTKNQLLANQVAGVATFLPAFLLSGFIYNIANMPYAIRWVTYLVPARYFVAVLKGIYLKGVGVEILAGQIVLLVIFAAAMLLMSHWTFHKKLE